MKQEESLSLLKEFLFPIVVVVTALFLTIFFLVPKVREIPKMRRDISNQEKQVLGLTQKLTDLQNLSEAELFNTTSLLLEALPAQKDFYKILTLTKKVFSDNSAQFKSFDFSPGMVSSESAEAKPGAADSSKMVLKVLFSASYDNFSSLLLSFSKVLPLVEIDSIKFDSLTASTSANILDLEGTLSLGSYFAPLPKTIGKIETPLPVLSSQGKSLTEELQTYQRYQPEASSSGEPVIVGKENPFP